MEDSFCKFTLGPMDKDISYSQELNLVNEGSITAWLLDVEKILKYRENAKQFYKVEVRNGKSASFWQDKWSPLGCLIDLLGTGGFIEMGITANAKVEDCCHHRKKKHRYPILNKVEMEIENFKEKRRQEEDDIYLWKNEKEKYKEKFSTKETWLVIREKHQIYDWHKAVWFKHATPKYSFVVWIAMRTAYRQELLWCSGI